MCALGVCLFLLLLVPCAPADQAEELSPTEKRLEELRKDLAGVRDKLEGLQAEEEQLRETVRAEHKAQREIWLGRQSDSEEIRKTVERIEALEKELKELRRELKKKLSSDPAIEKQAAKMRACVERMGEIRTQRRTLLQERMRIAGEIRQVEDQIAGDSEQGGEGDGGQ